MSYEEDYRRPYSAKCACGKGYLQFYRIYLSNDWGQEKENDTAVEIFCDSCKEKYHYERNYGNDYLVPNGLAFPKQRPELDRKYSYDDKEKLVKKYGREKIAAMVADMTAPKHRFIKNLENEDAISFANRWAQWYRKKSLSPMISYLQNILDQYSDLESSIECKKPYNEKYHQEMNAFQRWKWKQRRRVIGCHSNMIKNRMKPIKREEDGSRNATKKNIDMMILRQLFIMIRHIKEIFPINTGTVIL